jgi:hypothetical protein
MKNKIKFPAIVLGLLLLFTGINQKVFAQDEDVSLQTFYDELSPYGTWIQDEQYGYVWRPDVDQSEFRPYYTNGHWVMTEYGNTWVSDYDWGWAPFHYGRWVTDRYNQWLWIPDTTWGPAWVNWRTGGGYYGWAPLGPSLNISVGFNIPSFWWVFIPQNNIYYDRYPRYNWNRNSRYLRRTTVINNVYVYNRSRYYTGPSRDDIRRVTHRDVRVYNINRTDRPGRSRISNNTVHIYNPRPNRGLDNRNAAPRNSSDRGNFAGNNPGNRGNYNNNHTPDRNRSNAARPNTGNEVRNNNRMERPEASRERVGSVRQRPDVNPASSNAGGRSVRTPEERRDVGGNTRGAQQFDQQRQQEVQQMQQQREQQRQQQAQSSDQTRQRQQFDQQRQQQSQQMQQQREQQRQQQAQQRSQDQDRQRQQFDQQRQQQSQQMQQQREQQRQQQAQQRSQDQDRQRQQADQQRQQQAQQMQQQREQQRQQADQQRQQMQQQRQQRQEMPSAPQRMETRSNGGGDASRSGGGGRMSRGGGRG